MNINPLVVQIVVLGILFLVIGYLSGKLYNKRRNEIIKLLIKQDQLPPAAPNTTWINGGVCYMGDGSTGKVNGFYCEQIKVI